MFTLTSPAFAEGEEIPALYTCEDRNVSPPLAWSGAPEGTRSFALIVDDPDAPDPAAPKMLWVHWVLWDIPASVTELPEGASPNALPAGAHEGMNDLPGVGWTGPCPPIGRHRYYHHLYALDTELGDLGERVTRADLDRAMKGHILAEAVLMGTYQARGGRQ